VYPIFHYFISSIKREGTTDDKSMVQRVGVHKKSGTKIAAIRAAGRVYFRWIFASFGVLGAEISWKVENFRAD
jgi:hypothetical protein